MNKLTEEGLMKIIRENPDNFIKLLEKYNIDFEKTRDELDIARVIVREKYQMSNEDIHAVEFVFWFAYFVEIEIQDLIVEPETQLGARREAIQILVNKLYFRDKISVISELYVKDPKKDKFLKFLHKVNDLRNSVSHGRFDELKYGKYMLSDVRGQLKIVADLMNTLLRKKK